MMRRPLMLFAAAAWCALAASAWFTSAAAQPAAPPAASPPAAVPGAPPTEPPVQPTLGDDRETIEATRKWLSFLDSGKAGAAWDISSAYLKSVVTRPTWVTEINAARKPFGALKQRTPVRFARSHSMPGAPDGDYSFVELESVFVNGKQATEHVIWMLDKDEVWRVSGYFIR